MFIIESLVLTFTMAIPCLDCSNNVLTALVVTTLVPSVCIYRSRQNKPLKRQIRSLYSSTLKWSPVLLKVKAKFCKMSCKSQRSALHYLSNRFSYFCHYFCQKPYTFAISRTFAQVFAFPWTLFPRISG